MSVASRIAGDDAAKLEAVALTDLSFLPKLGLKGPGANQWLTSRDITLPAKPNRWIALLGGGFIARLGRSEFFLEGGTGSDGIGAVRSALGAGAPGVYPVIRQDAGFLLAGKRVNELLVETCNVNFAEIDPQDRVVVMTQMIGVSVLVIRDIDREIPRYRIWCDPTFAPYFWETLSEIAADLGGGVVGTDSVPRLDGSGISTNSP